MVSRKYQRNSWRIMSRRNVPQLDLGLNLSPPARRNLHPESPSRSSTSPPSSCVSSEVNQQESRQYSTGPEAISMMLVGCPRCLMYVMLAEEDPRCPKCKSSVLLDVIHDKTTTTKKTKKG
ncbi:uncharacterized protein LOC111412416 [Olea europaea var. sylvestris]|uniref:uncharacterized protein LOC111412416 n=1 Tax=Olea europaea var. sylvestris TaxID=158386 RepID=UPI000C1D76FA|nr:uncharacterized protein LOC111412416 [Olea europaea var. sylvestris]